MNIRIIWSIGFTTYNMKRHYHCLAGVHYTKKELTNRTSTVPADLQFGENMNDAEKLPTFVGVVMADGTEYKLTAMGGGGGDLIKNTYREVVSLDRIVGGLENVRAILFTVPGSNATMRVELPEISSNYLITRFICDKLILRFIVNKPTKEESTMASIELGEIQEAFAHIVWDREPIASGELVKVCEKELNWKKPTTYTVLRKLCEKGLLQNIDGVVTSVISREAFYSAKSEQFVQDTFK